MKGIRTKSWQIVSVKNYMNQILRVWCLNLFFFCQIKNLTIIDVSCTQKEKVLCQEKMKKGQYLDNLLKGMLSISQRCCRESRMVAGSQNWSSRCIESAKRERTSWRDLNW